MREKLLACARKLMKVTKKNDDNSWVLAEVAQVLKDLAESQGGEAASNGVTARPRLTKEARRALREAAKAGVASLQMDWDVDGSATVRINGGEPFRLQPKPAALLTIIAAPGGRVADDGLIGWRSYSEVAALLEKRTGRAVTARNVTKTIHKLKAVLLEESQNCFLVQTDRRGSVRFALCRDPPAAPAGGKTA